MLTMRIDEALARAYVETFGICAVVVSQVPDRQVSRIAVRDTVDFSDGQVRRRRATKTEFLVWCRDRAAAEAVVRGTVERVIEHQVSGSRSRFVLPAEKLFAMAKEAAQQSGIPVTPHERMARRVEDVVARVNELFANGSSHLQAANKKYRAMRISEERAGRKAPSYRSWLADYKAKTLEEVAAAHQRK